MNGLDALAQTLKITKFFGSSGGPSVRFTTLCLRCLNCKQGWKVRVPWSRDGIVVSASKIQTKAVMSEIEYKVQQEVLALKA